MLRPTLACDIECCAVVDGGSDERKAEGNIHGLAKRKAFDRNEPLVVIAGDNHIELSSRSPHKHRIARLRASYTDAVTLATRLNCRQHFCRLFNSKKATFGAMRIKRCNRNPRLFEPETTKLAIDQPDE